MQITSQINGLAGPYTQSFVAPDLAKGFGSIVLFNQSNSAISVFLGQTNVIGTPTFVIPAGVTCTYPIPGTKYVTVMMQVHPTTGTCSITLLEDVLSSSSSIVPFAGNQLVASNGYFTLPGSSIVVQWGETGLVPVDFYDGTVVFPFTFLLTMFSISMIVLPSAGADTTPIPTVCLVGAPGAASQSYQVGGGYPGTSGNIFWIAIGV
jgi:hypothetical protein